MNLRSRGTTNITPLVPDIRTLERENRRRRREEEQHAHLDRLSFEMAHHQNLNPAGEIPLGAAQEGDGQGAANLRPQCQPQHPQRPARAIGAYDQPHIHENNKYHGLAAEDPYDHLDKFDKYCSLSKNNGVSEDTFKLKLTAKIRNEISTFQQKNLESFSEAWERFKGYWSQCPHHGFTKESLLSTFYRGALPEYRARLDTASNGFFLGRTEEDAEELVDNMVKSDSVYSGEHDRTDKSDDQHTRKEIKSLQEKLDILIKEKAKQGQLNSVVDQKQKQDAGIKEVDGLEGQEELCFINANGTWYRKEPNFQYQNNYHQSPLYNNQPSQQQASPSTSTPQESNTNALLKQILESQTRSEKHVGYELKNLHNKIDGNYSDLNNKFLQLASRFNTLESQVASMPSSSKSSMGSLPGKPEKNSKESCNVDEIEKLVFGTELRKVEKLVVATAEAQMVDKAMERVQVQGERKVEATNLQRVELKAEKPVERRAGQKLKEVKKEDTEIELPPYEVPLPFLQRVLTKAQKKVISKFGKDLSDVGVRLPEISGMREAHIDPLVSPQSLPKLESQGKFTLSCSLGKITMNVALVDSGASVNVISLEMVKSLGIESMEANTSSLMFGDSSSTTPIGIIKDFPLKIGACTIPIDLTVLKMASAKRVPLILGTPFLTTVGACIDFPKKKVTLLNVNKVVSYPIQSPMDVGYCGTITCEESSIEKTQSKVVVPEKEGLAGESSKELKPMKLKDGVIEYKVKCKGRSKSFSSAMAIITPQLQNDHIKLQELLTQVLTITLEGGKDPPSH
ncbi:uncharacterized protein LOC130511269 [Raphanus sativus]|uniref:Uncharacterized protein LOC130511269 n=1 Tax=Raphanus sativus TaxID=3726 RepID=A0A9W3DL51_RAPSA|nr:uncharacterized protein LOC130511269 [Raphanus sativus]